MPLGILLGLAVVVLVAIPVVVMLFVLPPRGQPSQLGDVTGTVLYALVGAVVAVVLQTLRRRPAAAVTAAVIVVLLALWFQRGVWWFAGGVPAPPLVPLLPTGLVVAAGLVLGMLVVALTAGRREPPATSGPPVRSLIAGVVTAAVTVAATEGGIWGRSVLAETFQGPWGLTRFQWLLLVFLATVLGAGLVGWVVTSAARRPVAPALAAVLLLLAVLRIQVVDGLGGQPRIIVYGLSLGALVLGALAGLRRAPTAEGQG